MRLAIRHSLLLGAFYIGLCALLFGWARFEVRQASMTLMEETAHLIGSEIGNLLNDQLVDDLLHGGPSGRRTLLDQLSRLSRSSSMVLSVEVVDKEGEIFSSDRFEAIGRRLRPPQAIFEDSNEPKILAGPEQVGDPTRAFVLAVPMTRGETVVGYLWIELRSERIAALYDQSRRHTVLMAGIALALIAALGLGLHLSLARSSRAMLQTLEGALGTTFGEDSPTNRPGDVFQRATSAAHRLAAELDSERARRSHADERHDRIEHLLDVGLLLLDNDRHLDFATTRAARILGLPDHAPHEDFVLPPALADLVDLSMTLGAPRQATLELVGADSTSQSWSCRVTPLDKPSDECDGILIEFRDTSARKAIEIDLRQAAQLRNLTRVYMGVAHDLRAPLNGIVLNLELLEHFLDRAEAEGVDVQDPRRRFDLLGSEMERLQRTLQLILSQTAPLRDDVATFDLAEVLHDIADLLQPQARQQRIDFSVKGPVETWVEGQRDQVQQAILNIAINGLEAMPEGGSLSLNLIHENDQAVLTVEDSGPGIPPDVLASIFDMHFTTKQTGTGIGLYVARSIIEAQGGSIEAVSTSSQGTTFSLLLPLAPRD
ncbi:MAG: hypothetical protein K8J08_04440 [Thermoanaerobaculia bacterium]|nr:hypothetical protein [Thermoanaerobaculia bacterium]